MNTLTLQLKIDPSPGEDNVHIVVEIDGEPLAAFSYYAIDLEELFRSERDSGAFFIITCWCGQPACAGVGRGVAVEHRDGMVYWRVPEPGPDREYVFRETDYAQALRGLRREIKRFVAQRRYSGEGPYGVVAQYANEQYFRLGDEW
ncbi:MAG: hypothetical protein JWQ02_940 [Capsulimonas sp.]|nr:hypothetical protein [Capsulimonas sp.]